MTELKEVTILLVEDTEEHALLIRRRLEGGSLRHRLFLARDGKEALDYLFNRARYSSKKDYPKPDVILLDLRIPNISGIEVLEKIKAEEGLREIPVVVLTVSNQREDILKSCQAGARSYILKSVIMAPKTGGSPDILDAIISLV